MDERDISFCVVCRKKIEGGHILCTECYEMELEWKKSMDIDDD